MVWPLHTSEQISPPPQNNVHLFDGLIWSNNLSVIYRSSCTEFVVNFEIINNFPKLAQYIMRLPKRVLRRDTPTRIPMAVLNCLWLVMEQIPDYFSEFRANFIKISRFHNSNFFLYLNFPPQIISLFQHNLHFFGCFCSYFWPAPPAK